MLRHVVVLERLLKGLTLACRDNRGKLWAVLVWHALTRLESVAALFLHRTLLLGEGHGKDEASLWGSNTWSFQKRLLLLHKDLRLVLRGLMLFNEKVRMIISLLESLQVIILLLIRTGMTVSFPVTDLKRGYIFIVLEQACIRERVRFMLNLRLLGHKMLLNFGLLFTFIGDVWQVLILDCAH